MAKVQDKELYTNIKIALYKHEMERKLRESEARYRAIVEDQTELICRYLPDGILTFINDAYCCYFGKEREELIGHSFMPLIPEEDQELVERQISTLSLENPIATYEHRILAPGGEIRWQQWINRALFDEQNCIVEYQSVGHDVTERVRAKEALKASEAYARNVIESSLDVVITCDMERRIVEFNKAAEETLGYRREQVVGKHVDMLYADPQESLAVHETTLREGKCVQEILDRRKSGETFPAFLSASTLRGVSGEIVGVMGVSRDITERKRAEEALQQHNRELALLNRASQALVSTLDMDQVIVIILEEVCQLLGVTASSVWLVDPETDALVCQQASGPQRDIVLGWRLAPGEGIAGWVAHHGETLIVPDMRADERHFEGVDRQIGVELCSSLSVPLRVKQHVIGVLQVVDTEVGRFATSDLALLEPLAASAAIAIENARLYEQVQQDAETKSMLLREIDHRVKNNLTGIIGLLYAARNHARVEDQAAYQSAMNDLISRVRGLITVHSMLSVSGWAPLRLSALATRVMRASLQVLARGKRVSIDVLPSPVRVTSDQAHYLAMVINELATNTVKHALRERDTAHITFQIALDGDAVRCEFRDDGPGLPEDVLRLEYSSVGFDLIQNVVRDNLRGELSLRNDDGAAVTIQFKTGTRIREANDK